MTENKTLEGYRQEAIKEFTRLKVEGGRLGKAGENKELRTVELILETFRGTDVRLGLIDMDDEISSIYPIDVFDKAVAQAKAEGRRERDEIVKRLKELLMEYTPNNELPHQILRGAIDLIKGKKQ